VGAMSDSHRSPERDDPDLAPKAAAPRAGPVPKVAGPPKVELPSAGPPKAGPAAPSGDAVKARWARLWPWLAGIVAAASGAYGAGRVQGVLDTEAVREKAAQTSDAEKQQREALAAELAAAKERLELLRARRSLDRAARAITEHNYGLAQERVKTAAEMLGEREGYGELARELGAMNLLVPGESERLTADLRRAIETFDAVWAKRFGDGT
jgi:hypothetical protein